MTDVISRQDAIEAVKQAIYNHDSAIMRITSLPSASVEAVEVKADQLPPKVPTEWINDGMVLVPQHDWVEMQKKIEESASVEVGDCTEFVNWLLEEVMDEDNWELNAVANGEIICRKLKKLGLLEVKDGYYIRPSIEVVQGEWTYLSGSKGSYMTISCPICGSTFDGVAEWKYHYCPNCGAKMYKGGDDKRVETEMSLPKWIPVSERLPEVHPYKDATGMAWDESDDVLICMNYGNMHVATYEVDSEARRYWVDKDGLEYTGVIAWMPLPKPYEGSESDE